MTDRSPGVRDLRFGYVVDDDWAECDDGTCRTDHRNDVPLLVPPSSAHGHRRGRAPIEFRSEHRHPGAEHAR